MSWWVVVWLSLGAVALYRVADAATARAIVTNPELGAGEAYMDGRLVIEPPHEDRKSVV